MVRVVRAEKLKQDHRLRREGCVLFAMLAGGDYDIYGLARCGAATALKAAQAGLGLSLCKSKSQEDCERWTANVLLRYFKKEGVTISIPARFPVFQTLQKYNDPKVLPDNVLQRNAELRPDYKHKVDEVELLLITSHRYNTWGKGYMDWVAPTLLTQALANQNAAPSHDLATWHAIELIGKQGRKKHDDSA
ncbi:hypothetical protein EK21DRAFT_109345 [Setomelanomma holmii]|uniref:Uncharacterized protein n=1 Tax=Setomelanomma holmii TaxID=210430 RepID=A0A9P4LQY0_9PLEO|nr:hypothetical protein EK21DRAFT_109345 [Setomelanomma holmii]